MCVDAGASFALSSDAHEPGQIGFEYDQALEFLSDHGVSEIATFEGTKADDVFAVTAGRRARDRPGLGLGRRRSSIRRILPVRVFGSSSMNSISRG